MHKEAQLLEHEQHEDCIHYFKILNGYCEAVKFYLLQISSKSLVFIVQNDDIFDM